MVKLGLCLCERTRRHHRCNWCTTETINVPFDVTARGRLLSAATETIFVPLPRRGGPAARPLSGAREGCIDECSFQIQLAAIMHMPSQHLQSLFQLAAADPPLKTPVTGLVWRVFFRQFAPLCPDSQRPKHVAQHSACVMQWAPQLPLVAPAAIPVLHLTLFVC